MISSGIELTPDIPIDRLAPRAERAEAAGFDAIFVSVHYSNRDPFQALDRIAMATEAIRIGPGVVNPYDTHPAVTAGRTATLHESSAGRAVYGVGAGDRSTLDSLGLTRNKPLARVRESIEIARKLFAGDRVTTDSGVDAGLHFDVDDLGPIPIFVGAQGPQMLRMSGIYADGILINGSHPRDIAWASDQIDATRGRRPAERKPVRTLAHACVSVGPDGRDAREAARPPVAYITAGAPDRVLERHDIDGDRAAAIRSAIKTGRHEKAFATVTAPMIEAFAIAGTVETVADRMTTLLAHVDGIVVGSPIGPDPDAAITLAARALARAREASS